MEVQTCTSQSVTIFLCDCTNIGTSIVALRLLEDSYMPVGWPLHIDGAVRQCCIHRAASLQELDDMLKEYDMKRDSVEINRDAPQ